VFRRWSDLVPFYPRTRCLVVCSTFLSTRTTYSLYLEGEVLGPDLRTATSVSTHLRRITDFASFHLVMPSSSLAFIPQQRSRIRHLLRSEKNDTTREQEKDSSQPFETILSLSVVVNEILERSRQRHLDLHVLKRELKKEIGSIDESLAEELSWEERIEKFAVWKRELWDALRTEKPPYWSLQTNKKRLFGNIRYYWKPRSVQYVSSLEFCLSNDSLTDQFHFLVP